MLTLNEVERGCQVVLDVENIHIFGYAKELLPKGKKSREKFNMSRIDGLIPGSVEAVERMRANAEKGLDLYDGNPADMSECEEMENDEMQDDIDLLWGNKLPSLFRG